MHLPVINQMSNKYSGLQSYNNIEKISKQISLMQVIEHLFLATEASRSLLLFLNCLCLPQVMKKQVLQQVCSGCLQISEDTKMREQITITYRNQLTFVNNELNKCTLFRIRDTNYYKGKKYNTQKTPVWLLVLKRETKNSNIATYQMHHKRQLRRSGHCMQSLP